MPSSKLSSPCCYVRLWLGHGLIPCGVGVLGAAAQSFAQHFHFMLPLPLSLPLPLAVRPPLGTLHPLTVICRHFVGRSKMSCYFWPDMPYFYLCMLQPSKSHTRAHHAPAFMLSITSINILLFIQYPVTMPIAGFEQQKLSLPPNKKTFELINAFTNINRM